MSAANPSRRDGAITTGRTAAVRSLLRWAALGYTAFVIYGSMVPLHFRQRPLGEAWEYFQHIPYLELGIGSRADWVANILLFVPLAFLWLGVLWPKRGSVARVLGAGFVLLCCVGLSAGIEFTQIFFPPRTVSLNDMIAESIGAVIGIALWWLTGANVARWLAGWSQAHAPAGAAERFLYVYLFLLFGYSVMPLDLTISVVEIYHKWQEGKVLLIPFSAIYKTGAERAYALLADVAIWIPAAFLWQLSSSRPARTVIFHVITCAATIECLQLFVYSRVTSTTDIITAGCGGAVGVLLARWLRPTVGDHAARGSATATGVAALLWFFAVVGWIGVLMVVFWYPFNFSNEWGFVHERVGALKRVPFEAYYYGTEFRAVTEVFHKTGFFFPLGALLAIGAVYVRKRVRLPAALLNLASVTVVAGVAAGIEAGQLFLPGKNADSTDWLLETLGGLAGYVCLRILGPLWQSGRDGSAQSRTQEHGRARRARLEPGDTGHA